MIRERILAEVFKSFNIVSIKGSYLIAEQGPFESHVGMMLDPKDKILLFCTKGKERDIIERIIRIGFMNLCGYADFTMK